MSQILPVAMIWIDVSLAATLLVVVILLPRIERRAIKKRDDAFEDIRSFANPGRRRRE